MMTEALRPAIGVMLLTGAIADFALAIAQPDDVRCEQVPASPEVIELSYAVSAPVAPARGLMLLFTVNGTTYAKLGNELPRHGKPHLIESEGIEVAIAPIAEHDVPAAHRGWLHRKMRVDNTCEANVTGFAVVARAAGDDEGPWTANSVLEHGESVLAAQLDGCPGTFARDAALPAITILHGTPDVARGDALIARARQLVIASAASRDAQRTWTGDYGQSGTWYDDPDTTFTTSVLHNPISNMKWISVHAYNEEGCGDPGANIWGLFLVRDDGTLETQQLHATELTELQYILDVDDRGQLALIGPSWLETSIVRANGDKIESVGVPFFGCGC